MSSRESNEHMNSARRRILEPLGLTPLAVLARATVSVSERASALLQPNAVSNTVNTFTLTATPLSAGASTTIGPLDCTSSDEVGVTVYANQPGTLYVETSINNSSWRVVDTVQVASAAPINRVYSVTTRWMRLRYRNGGIAQTVFELGAVQR
jgi:hypothetical protein